MNSQLAKIRLRSPSFSRTLPAICFVILGATTVIGFVVMFRQDKYGNDAVATLFSYLGKMFFQPSTVHMSLGEGVVNIVFTLCLGILTTITGAVLGVLGALVVARNIGHPIFGAILRGFAAFVRAVPTVLWVLIFAIGAGLGTVAAVVGMTFHSFGYLLKAYSESFEEIDQGTIEALKASGARWWVIVTQAVLPSSAGNLVSWTFLRLEINFTTAVAMGTAAGAGGIGFDLYQAAYTYVNIRDLGTMSWLILIVAIILELIAVRMKRGTQLQI